MKWAFKDFHKQIGDTALAILLEYSIVYLAMEERTNKSSVVLWAAEQADYEWVLIVTTKKALVGWREHLANLPLTKEYELTNFEQVKNLPPRIYGLVIVDEAHNYSTAPNTSKRWKDLKKRIGKADVALLSATPSTQTYTQLYHQFKLSKYTPWCRFRNYRNWFRWYGIPETIYVAGRVVNKLVKGKDELIMADDSHIYIKYTRSDLGF